MALSMKEKKAERSEAAWPRWISDEFEKNQSNGCVGTKLLSETERVRVWEIRLKPGERIGFHRHVLDYFWTAVTAGRGRSRMQDGTTVENTGEAELVFTTVEFLDSANAALPVPGEVRAKAA